jgi:crossover junction endodeoxyribonuclease RusA
MYRVFRGRSIMSKEGRAYVLAVAAIVEESRQPMLTGPLSVTIHCVRPNRLRRDLDNLTKGLLDSLTKARYWSDDSQIQRLSLEWDGYTPGGEVHVTTNACELL